VWSNCVKIIDTATKTCIDKFHLSKVGLKKGLNNIFYLITIVF